MPKLYSSGWIVKILEQHNFVLVSQKGSHAKYRKSVQKATYTVIIPIGRKEIPYGTFRSILRQSRLQEEEFI